MAFLELTPKDMSLYHVHLQVEGLNDTSEWPSTPLVEIWTYWKWRVGGPVTFFSIAVLAGSPSFSIRVLAPRQSPMQENEISTSSNNCWNLTSFLGALTRVTYKQFRDWSISYNVKLYLACVNCCWVAHFLTKRAKITHSQINRACSWNWYILQEEPMKIPVAKTTWGGIIKICINRLVNQSNGFQSGTCSQVHRLVQHICCPRVKPGVGKLFSSGPHWPLKFDVQAKCAQEPVFATKINPNRHLTEMLLVRHFNLPLVSIGPLECKVQKMALSHLR